MALMDKNYTARAMIRTTIAPTQLEGSVQDNLIPAVARGVVNFRILPGEDSASVLERTIKIINDGRVSVAQLPKGFSEPSPVSDINDKSFYLLQRTVAQVYSDAFFSPFLMQGASDSRHFCALSQNVYRFSPVLMTSGDMKMVHGINERIKIKDYEQTVKFYIQLLKNINFSTPHI